MQAAALKHVPALLLLALADCTAGDAGPAVTRAPAGPLQIFRALTGAAPGHELILVDLTMAPGMPGAAHSHPWEEYLYVIEGSVVLDIAGQPQRTVLAGEGTIIPARTVHTPRGGPSGLRAIVTRIHDEGDPVSIPAPD